MLYVPSRREKLVACFTQNRRGQARLTVQHGYSIVCHSFSTLNARQSDERTPEYPPPAPLVINALSKFWQPTIRRDDS